MEDTVKIEAIKDNSGSYVITCNKETVLDIELCIKRLTVSRVQNRAKAKNPSRIRCKLYEFTITE